MGPKAMMWTAIGLVVMVGGLVAQALEPSSEEQADAYYADVAADRAALREEVRTCSEWLALSYPKSNRVLDAWADMFNFPDVLAVKNGCLGYAYSNAHGMFCEADKYRSLEEHVKCAKAMATYDPDAARRTREAAEAKARIDARIAEGD